MSTTATETLVRPDPEPSLDLRLQFKDREARSPAASTVGEADRQRTLLRGWILLLCGAALLEPLGDSEAATLWWHQLSSVAFAVMLLPMLFSLFIRARWGAEFSTLTALVAIPVAIGCGTSGHHETWWWYELIGSAMLAAYGIWAVLSGRSLQRATPPFHVSSRDSVEPSLGRIEERRRIIGSIDCRCVRSPR